MYAIPIVAIVVLALIATAWSPILALIVAVPIFVLFLVYIGMRPRADEKVEPPTGSAEKYEDDVPKGAWGEPRGE
jgi:Sec-independent protein secretion pathway component TatC